MGIHRFTPTRLLDARLASDFARFAHSLHDIPIIRGRRIDNVALAAGETTAIAHGLGRVPRGWALAGFEAEGGGASTFPTVVASEGFQEQSAPGGVETYTLATAPTEGNALLVAVRRGLETDALAGVADNGGGAWSLVETVTRDNTRSMQRVELWFCNEVLAGTTQVQIDYDSLWGNAVQILIVEVAGAATSGHEYASYDELTAPAEVTISPTLSMTADKWLGLWFVVSKTGGGGYEQFLTANAAWDQELKYKFSPAINNDACYVFSRNNSGYITLTKTITGSSYSKTCGVFAGIAAPAGAGGDYPRRVSWSRDTLRLESTGAATVSLWVF